MTRRMHRAEYLPYFAVATDKLDRAVATVVNSLRLDLPIVRHPPRRNPDSRGKVGKVNGLYFIGTGKQRVIVSEVRGLLMARFEHQGPNDWIDFVHLCQNVISQDKEKEKHLSVLV